MQAEGEPKGKQQFREGADLEKRGKIEIEEARVSPPGVGENKKTEK